MRKAPSGAILRCMEKPTDSSPLPQLEPLILTLRGYRVILDSDLARLYGVTTKTLNQSLKRNLDRYPSDFAFQLIPEEMQSIRSEIIGFPAKSALNGEKTNWSQFENSSEDPGDLAPDKSRFSKRKSLRRGLVYLPWAFTEHGALMAANMLRSQQAAQMSVYVVRAFVKMRQVTFGYEELSRRMAEAELALREHDAALVDVYDKLEPLLDPQREEPTTRVMGFRSEEA